MPLYAQLIAGGGACDECHRPWHGMLHPPGHDERHALRAQQCDMPRGSREMNHVQAAASASFGQGAPFHRQSIVFSYSAAHCEAEPGMQQLSIVRHYTRHIRARTATAATHIRAAGQVLCGSPSHTGSSTAAWVASSLTGTCLGRLVASAVLLREEPALLQRLQHAKRTRPWAACSA